MTKQKQTLRDILNHITKNTFLKPIFVDFVLKKDTVSWTSYEPKIGTKADYETAVAHAKKHELALPVAIFAPDSITGYLYGIQRGWEPSTVLDAVGETTLLDGKRKMPPFLMRNKYAVYHSCIKQIITFDAQCKATVHTPYDNG